MLLVIECSYLLPREPCISDMYLLQANVFVGLNDMSLFEGGSYYSGVTQKQVLVHVDPSEAYGPIVFNNGSSTIFALINITAYAEGDPSEI